MRHLLVRLTTFLILLIPLVSAHAVDSYRYAHVTIDTPWNIFLFLLVIVLLPFILMAILYWHFAVKSAREKKESVVREGNRDNE